MKKFIGFSAILTIFLFSVPKVYTEKILTLITDRIILPIGAQVTKEGRIHLEESLSLNVKGETELLNYIKISIFVPNVLKKYSDSFILQVFKRITPPPTKGKRVFYGKKVFSTFLPYLNRIYLEIPYKYKRRNKESLKANKNKGEYLLPQIKKEDFPILITIQPLMKGIPDYIFNHYFSFSITPAIENIGFLKINIENSHTNAEYTIFVDGKKYPNPFNKIKLQAGIHQIQIQSEKYESTNSVVTIEPGKTTVANIKLKQNLSSVKFETPENAVIYVDGNRLEPEKEKINLKPGDHIIRIKIEDYSITRKLTVKTNKHYIVSLIFDILLKEY